MDAQPTGTLHCLTIPRSLTPEYALRLPDGSGWFVQPKGPVGEFVDAPDEDGVRGWIWGDGPDDTTLIRSGLTWEQCSEIVAQGAEIWLAANPQE